MRCGWCHLGAPDSQCSGAAAVLDRCERRSFAAVLNCGIVAHGEPTSCAVRRWGAAERLALGAGQASAPRRCSACGTRVLLQGCCSCLPCRGRLCRGAGPQAGRHGRGSLLGESHGPGAYPAEVVVWSTGSWRPAGAWTRPSVAPACDRRRRADAGGSVRAGGWPPGAALRTAWERCVPSSKPRLQLRSAPSHFISTLGAHLQTQCRPWR